MAFNIKRDFLDIIITDSLPNELPIIFSLYNFYEYLETKKVSIDNIKNELIDNLTNKQTIFSDGNWDSTPLKFSIKKSDYHIRELSIPSPIAMFVVHLFLSVYEKDILSTMKLKSIFSIRYHTKNNHLYYRKRTKKAIEYYDQTGKDSIQQTGMYFCIVPYRSISDYFSSKKWHLNNRVFSNYAKIDYKDCFGSIYTHSFKWISAKNAIDSIEFSNNSMLTVIDKVLQKINGKQTNGIIVGPEFSRMFAEILLQEIDYSVYYQLIEANLKKGTDYEVSRFVDDIYIFARTKKISETIVRLFEKEANNLHIKINESKLILAELPYNHSPWIRNVSSFSEQLLGKMFEVTENEFSLRKYKRSVFKREFNVLMSENQKDRKSIVSYVIGSIHNKYVELKKNKTIFNKDSRSQIKFEIELLMYFHSFFPNYDNTQKYISILFLINEATGFFTEEADLAVFHNLVRDYSFIFEHINVSDIVNYMLLCAKYKIELPNRIEKIILDEIVKQKNPLNFAVFLLYSRYNKGFQDEIITLLSKEINIELDSIIDNSKLFLYKEFWWIVIFINCPYIDVTLKAKMKAKFAFPTTVISTSQKAVAIITDYFIQSDPIFILWDIDNIDVLKKIMFKTNFRTVFKGKTSGFDGYEN